MVRRIVVAFFKNDLGQDIAEYCLLTALVALVALGVFVHMAGGVQAIWNTANSTITVNSNAGGAAGNGDSGSHR